MAFGLFRKGRLVSLATSLALTPKHCDVGVYTLPRYRNRGYATGCVESIFAATFDQGARPLWRIGIRQKLAIYFAEKLEMEEIELERIAQRGEYYYFRVILHYRLGGTGKVTRLLVELRREGQDWKVTYPFIPSL